MIKDLNQGLEHMYSTLTYENAMNKKYNKEVILKLFKIDDMLYFIRHFMAKFLELLIKDFIIYIDNTSYINWGILFFGFISFWYAWYYILRNIT